MTNEVFFLGAGFSKAIDDSYPTLKKLTNEINDNLVTEKDSISQHFRNEIPLAYKHNIELLLSFLDSKLPYKTPAQMDADSALYKNIITYISKYFNKKHKKNFIFNETYKKLATYIKDSKSTCITLNYDILLEDLIYSTVTEGFKQANKNYSVFYKISIIELGNRIPDSYGA